MRECGSRPTVGHPRPSVSRPCSEERGEANGLRGLLFARARSWTFSQATCADSMADGIARSGLAVALTRTASPSVHAPATASGYRRPAGRTGTLRRPRVARRAFVCFLTYRIRCKGAKFVSSGLYVESARPRWPVESSLSRAGPGFAPCAAAFNLHPLSLASESDGAPYRAYTA
jgi:hypothetical protein